VMKNSSAKPYSAGESAPVKNWSNSSYLTLKTLEGFQACAKALIEVSKSNSFFKTFVIKKAVTLYINLMVLYQCVAKKCGWLRFF